MTRSQRIAYELLLPVILLLASCSYAESAPLSDLAPTELSGISRDLSVLGQNAVSAQGAMAVVQQSGQDMAGRIVQRGAELEA